MLKGVLSKLNDLREESKAEIIRHNPLGAVTVASAMLLGEQLTDESLKSLVQEVKDGKTKLGLVNSRPMLTAKKLTAQQAAGENVRLQLC